MDILATALSVLVILVITHIAVFWVVRTLYPPTPTQIVVPAPAPTPAPIQEPVQQTFTQPTKQDHVTVPTYETSIQLEAPNQERGGNFADTQSSSVQRSSGLDAPNAQ